MKIPDDILREYTRQKQTNKHAWIGYNAIKNEYRCYIIPYSWLNSLLIVKIEQPNESKTEGRNKRDNINTTRKNIVFKPQTISIANIMARCN